MILTAVDDGYLDEAAVLIKSCARYVPEQRFYLYLVNSTAARVAPLEAVHPRLIVEHVTWPRDPATWRDRMCCARTVPLLHVLQTYGEPTLYLDSDTMVRGSLDALFALLDTHDLAVLHRPEIELRGAGGTLDGGKFNSGVIAIRPSAIGLEFAAEYDRRVRAWIDSGRPAGYVDPQRNVYSAVDQEFLYTTYLDFQARLSFAPLPAEFNDARLRPGSTIWHGKGTMRSRPLYVLAKLSYGPAWRYYLAALTAYPLHYARASVNVARGWMRKA
jgi:hypothetical protein